MQGRESRIEEFMIKNLYCFFPKTLGWVWVNISKKKFVQNLIQNINHIAAFVHQGTTQLLTTFSVKYFRWLFNTFTMTFIWLWRK